MDTDVNLDVDYFHLILILHSSFTNCLNNVLYNKNTQHKLHLISSNLKHFLHLYIFMTLTLFEMRGQLFCRTSLNLHLYDVSGFVDLSYVSWQEYHRSDAVYSLSYSGSSFSFVPYGCHSPRWLGDTTEKKGLQASPL